MLEEKEIIGTKLIASLLALGIVGVGAAGTHATQETSNVNKERTEAVEKA
jgi:hypothetical protein